MPLRLSYPEGWRLTREKHGGEDGYKIVGKNGGGHDAEINVSAIPRGEYTFEQFVHLAEKEHLSPLADYRKVSSGQRSFGSPRVEGVTQYSTFKVNGLPAKHQALFFADRDRYYCLSILSAAWTQDEMRNLFDRITASIRMSE